MLVRELRRLVFVVLPLLLLTFVSWKFYKNESIRVPFKINGSWIDTASSQSSSPAPPAPPPPPAQDEAAHAEQAPGLGTITSDQLAAAPPAAAPSPPPAPPARPKLINPADTHNILYSQSTPDKKYFKVHMGNQRAMNPNIIPHPSLPETWIVVAQADGKYSTDPRYFTEYFCNAQFDLHGNLTCIEDPLVLPVEPTISDKCTGDIAFATYNVGPHDARVFMGPQHPYTIYGSQSSFTCFGLWTQDIRYLIPWGNDRTEPAWYSTGTELQRPLPWGEVEKNFFLFWDKDNNVYAHHDIAPTRVFAKVEADGSVGPNLAPAATTDDQCLAKYFPKIIPESESIHQDTNSLSITLCNRKDAKCVPTDDNTVLFTLYQYKKWYQLRGLYEPYVMAFKRTAPFQIHGMSKKPLWISGRVVPEAKSEAEDPHGMFGQQMVYIVSMNWKKAGQNYHGFLDDELFITFGIEDHDTAAIDVLAGDLFKDFGLCD